MLGKEIANNLRNSKEKWGHGRLLDGDGAYCVLGLKLHETGVSDEWLHKLDDEPLSTLKPYGELPLLPEGLCDITEINDAYETKEDVIEAFDSPEHANVNFPIEEYREWLRQAYGI